MKIAVVFARELASGKSLCKSNCVRFSIKLQLVFCQCSFRLFHRFCCLLRCFLIFFRYPFEVSMVSLVCLFLLLVVFGLPELSVRFFCYFCVAFGSPELFLDFRDRSDIVRCFISGIFWAHFRKVWRLILKLFWLYFGSWLLSVSDLGAIVLVLLFFKQKRHDWVGLLVYFYCNSSEFQDRHSQAWNVTELAEAMPRHCTSCTCCAYRRQPLFVVSTSPLVTATRHGSHINLRVWNSTWVRLKNIFQYITNAHGHRICSWHG